mmetsp:Transcript_14021/g.28435  ORF Transcript_14021/g.28435 Transcript_14021/m.28435 type:complete len:285 (-) Transcript_14021:102-956(-)
MLEGVRLRVRRDVEVSRHAVDKDHAPHHAALVPAGAQLDVALGDGLRVVRVVHVLLHKPLERVMRPVAHVALMRMRVMPAVHLHCREGVHVLRVTEVLPASTGAVGLSEEYVVGVRRLHHVHVRLLPHWLQPAAPRAPWCVKVDQHEALLLDCGEEGSLVEIGRYLGHFDVIRRQALSVHRLLLLCMPAQRPHAAPLGIGLDTRLDDVGGDVLEVRAHDIDDVEGGEPARQVVQRHVEVQLQLLLLRGVEHNRGLLVDAEVGREVADEQIGHHHGADQRDRTAG